MLILGITFTFYPALANFDCLANPCVSCSSGYNFQSVSCLPICPAGFAIAGNKCNPGQSQDLFNINFISFRNFDASSIVSFSHPKMYKFSNETRVTPIPTIDRGFYFFSSYYLISNTSWVLSPRFCIGIYYKALNPGILFQVSDDERSYLSVIYNVTLQIWVNTTNGTHYFNQVYSFSYNNQWAMNTFWFRQQNNYFQIYGFGRDELTFYREFRMETTDAKFSIGASNNSSFSGFLAYLSLKNSNICVGKSARINDCLFNQYYNFGCHDCPSDCSLYPFCNRDSSNVCYSNSCGGCKGYLLDQCEDLNIETFNLGKNCESGSGFSCDKCVNGYTSFNGLCILSPTNFTTITLRLDLFTKYQGDYFQSGLNASTYSPFNNPEEDDPVALSSRGYWFNHTQHMTALDMVMNYTFSIFTWADANSIFIIHCPKFSLMYDASFRISLANSERSLSEFVDGECFDYYWRFFGIIVDFYGNATHFKVVCGSSITNTQSVSGYAFYDSIGSIIISPMHNTSNYLYRVTISQYPQYSFTNLLQICSSGSSCLAHPSYYQYNNMFTKRIILCDSSCKSGCSRWGSCNQCSNILCPYCDGFNLTCTESTTFQPCIQGFQLSEDTNFCCNERCLSCHGETAYLCSKCSVNYVLVGTLCTHNCPSKYFLNGSLCVAPSENPLLDITFDKIEDSFSDSLGNVFYTGFNDQFYPNSTIYDPIPALSRGFYFNRTSIITTSNFSIPNNFTLSFWIKQSISGILLQKGLLEIQSKIRYTYGSISRDFHNLIKNEWVVMHLRVLGC